MGTNYFSVTCGFEDREDFWELRETPDVLHIGKSSGGWCFSLHVIPEMGINDLEDWIPIFIDPERVMIDEYRNRIDLNEIMRIITARSWPKKGEWTMSDYRHNYAEPGPDGLVRHAIGHGCVKNGAGTWDCIVGYFS